jgi:hypothetical protein
MAVWTPSEDSNKRTWRPQFYSNTTMPSLTEKDLQKIKFQEKRRREREVNRQIVDTFNKLTDRGYLTKDGLVDVKKADTQNDIDIKQLMKKILEPR